MSDEAPRDARRRKRKPRKKREKVPSAYRIEIIERRCTGVGTCMEEAPFTFDMNDMAIAMVSNPNGDPDEKILAAAKSCPVDAIFLYRKDDGEKVWPPREKRFERGEGDVAGDDEA